MLSEFAKKNWGKLVVALVTIVFVNACSFNESRIKSIVDREIGASLIVERARLELEKQLGRRDSKLKSSLLELISGKIKIEYSEVLVEGRKARLKVKAEVPRLEDIGALFSEARTIPREKMVEMSAEELLREVVKNSRRPASATDFQTEFYEFYIDFEKGKEWVADTEDLKKAYSKKNLVIH